MSWLRDAMDWVAERTPVHQRFVGDRVYVDSKVEGLKPPLCPDALTFNTLDALVWYIKTNLDKLWAGQCIVQVATPTDVHLYATVEELWKRRASIANVTTAQYVGTPFQFGKQYDQETFTIALQAAFTDAGDRKKVLELVGNLRGESVVTAHDDGVTQRVETAVGARLKGNENVPNPVMLSPWRTFREVEQPLSAFVFRAHAKEGALPTLSLHQADGDAWKLTAIKSVAAYLDERLGGAALVLA